MLTPATIQTIRDTARIEDVVADFVALRKRGTSLVGLCPFHQERSPSFHVHPVRGIFKCFGCGQGGDVFAFLQEHESLSFHEAARWLAKKYHLEVIEIQPSPEQAAEQHEAETLHIILDFAGKYYTWLLTTTAPGQAVAGAYLQERDIHATSIEKFGLGYASGPADLLHWLRKRGYSIPHASRAGLCNTAATRDFFHQRIIFPIHSLSGKIIAFAGRTSPENPTSPERATSLGTGSGMGTENVAKYLNTPESPIYQKSKTLYGLYQARQAIRQQDECILVEGYFDVISLHQAGLENVVASCGTALTTGQLQLIRRFTTNLIILYDGDPAGLRATTRGLDLALEQDLNIKIVLLPAGEDPDGFIRKVGAQPFRDYLTTYAQDFILFQVGLLLPDIQDDPVKKSAAIHRIAESIAKIPDAIKRSLYIRQCADLVQVPENLLTQAVIKLVASQRPATRTEPLESSLPATTLPDEPAHERDIIRLLIQHGGQPLADEGITIADYLLSNLGDPTTLPQLFGNALYRQVVKECLGFINEKKTLTEYNFLHHPSPALRQLSQDLVEAEKDWPISPQWAILEGSSIVQDATALDTEVRQSLARFNIYKLTALLEQNQERIRLCPPDDTATIDRYCRVGILIRQTRSQIASEYALK